MAFHQHVRNCAEHLDCTVIEHVDDKRMASASHAPSMFHAEHRLHPDLPATDHRGKKAAKIVAEEPCESCAALAGAF